MPYIEATLQEPRALRRRTGRFNLLTRPTVCGGYSRQHGKRLQHKCLRFEQCCVIGLTVCRCQEPNLCGPQVTRDPLNHRVGNRGF